MGLVHSGRKRQEDLNFTWVINPFGSEHDQNKRWRLPADKRKIKDLPKLPSAFFISLCLDYLPFGRLLFAGRL
jgi:hypothetical protein